MDDDERRISKFFRVYSDHNVEVLSGIAHKYLSYLLPALTKSICFATSCVGTEHKVLQKLVRFELDLGLVICADGFKWSHALKQRLINQSINYYAKIHKCPTLFVASTMSIKFASENINIGNIYSDYGHVEHPKIVAKSQDELNSGNCWIGRTKSRNICTNKMIDDEELAQLMTSLRCVLPGGNEISSDLSELITEVESYVVCLQLQVNILKSLVEVC